MFNSFQVTKHFPIMRHQLILTIIHGSAILSFFQIKRLRLRGQGSSSPEAEAGRGFLASAVLQGALRRRTARTAGWSKGRSRGKRHLGRGPASAWDHRGLWGMLHWPWSHLKASALALPPRASSVPGCMLPWVGTRWDVQAPGHGGPSWPSVSRGQLCL